MPLSVAGFFPFSKWWQDIKKKERQQQREMKNCNYLYNEIVSDHYIVVVAVTANATVKYSKLIRSNYYNKFK